MSELDELSRTRHMSLKKNGSDEVLNKSIKDNRRALI